MNPKTKPRVRIHSKAKHHAQRLYPWLVWGLAAGFYFYKSLLEVSPSVMHGVWMKEFNITATQLGNLAAIYFWAYLIMQIPMGIFTDRFGPRRVTTIAIFLCALGTAILMASHTLFTASVGRFVTGLGASVAAIGCFKLTTLWFPPRRFPTLAGLMMTIGMIGAIGGEAPLSISMDWIGWRNSLLYIAVIGFLFYMLNQLFGPITLVYQFPPLLAAIIPTFLFLFITMILLARTK